MRDSEMKEPLSFKVGNAEIDLKEMPTILACGSTGCGKSYLLKEIWKQLSSKYKGNMKFVFIDMKLVEYNDIKEKNMLFPVANYVEEVDKILDELLNKNYSNPVVVFWDVFEDYLLNLDRALNKFKILLSEGPKKQMYTVCCSSTVRMGEEYTRLFSAVFLGNWFPESLELFMPKEVKQVVSKSSIDFTKLKRGEFIFIQGDNTQLVKTLNEYE